MVILAGDQNAHLQEPQESVAERPEWGYRVTKRRRARMGVMPQQGEHT